MPVCGVSMHRKDIDDSGVIWALGDIPVPAEKGKELMVSGGRSPFAMLAGLIALRGRGEHPENSHGEKG